jgi:nitroreductase
MPGKRTGRNHPLCVVEKTTNCRVRNVGTATAVFLQVLVAKIDPPPQAVRIRKVATTPTIFVFLKSARLNPGRAFVCNKEKNMNQIMETLLQRKSVRAYEPKEISAEVRGQILEATLRAPTAGNMMLYSIVEVTDQRLKDRLAVTCDNQPFIAKTPLVWLFLADYQRWYDYFIASGVERLCSEKNIPMRKPEEGDLFLACGDALIAAQNAVIAAESLGLGSCYIGDIMENYEIHKELFNLPRYVFPIALLCFGYPTQQQKERELTPRFDQKFIVFENQYRQLEKPDFDEMFAKRSKHLPAGAENMGQQMYLRKFSADFSVEMSRSARAILKEWTNA